MSQDSGIVPDPQERPVPRIEDIHRLLLNESPDPIFAFAPDGEYLYVNRAFAEGVQKRVEQILGRRIWDVFPREEADKRFAALNSVFQSGIEKVIEVRVPRTDRDHYYVTTITPIKDAEGRVTTVICSSKDITERKQAELALKESEEINRVISGLTTDYSFIVDVTPVGSLQLRWASLNLAEITGRGLEESATPDHWRAIIHRDDLPLFFAFVQRTLESGEASTLECRSLVHGGRTRWIQISVKPQIDEMGRVRTIYGAVKEISERKWTEMALRESEARMAAFMEYVPAMILIKDHEFRPVFANTRFRERFPFEDWLQKTPQDLFPPEVAEAMVQMDTRALEEGSITFEEAWKDQSGTLHQYRTTKFRIDLAGAHPLIGAIILDITDQKRAEEDREKLQDQLLQAQKMESVGRLAGGVAHDFNNMLQAIMGYTELALTQVDSGQPLHASLEQIQKTAKRSADLTRQLLAFARKQTVEPRDLDLNEVVDGTLSMMRRLIGEDIDLVWKPGIHLGVVRMDPSQIDQVLANLCVNARDAIAGVGRIVIETACVHFDQEHCLKHPEHAPGDYVVLSLSDSGSGMSPEVLEHLFEPFFTTKGLGQGTGLGLATVYGIVKQNLGFIDVASEAGRGTTFRIHLPRKALSEAPRPGEAPEGEAKAGSETILIVEDEPAILEMCRIMLERLGYGVLGAGAPREALALAAEHAGRIDLLLIDVILPEMNGRELGQRLMAQYPGIKRLYMSGYTADVIAQQGQLEEGVHLIQKPFTMKELSSKVREVLEKD